MEAGPELSGGQSLGEYIGGPTAWCRQAQSNQENIHKIPLPEPTVYNFVRRFGESLYIVQVLPGVVCAVPEADVPPTPAALPHHTGIPHILNCTVLYCTVLYCTVLCCTYADQVLHGTLLIIL